MRGLREFAEHGWSESDVPDPQDVATFERSRLDWDEPCREPHARLLAWYRGKPTGYGERDSVVVTVWRDKDAVRAWAGASAGPVMLGGQHELADAISVEQFELEP